VSWRKKLWLNGLVRADWLNRDRVLSWSGVLLALETLLLGFMVLWYNNVFGWINPQVSTDFVSFYAAGKLALAGTPALAYDHAAHAAAEIAATQPHTAYQFFFYPPVYLLICAPLALLPYMVGFVIFQAVTLVAWLLVMNRILDARGLSWCLPVLAYPAVFWTLGLGQNAFLTAALIGGITLSVDKRPILAGFLLGLLSYKPHLALLIPIALAAGGRWRAVAAAAVSATAIIGLSTTIFGADTWQAYLTAMGGSRAVYENGSIDLAGFVTPYGAARVLGVLSSGAWIVQAMATTVTILTVGWIWRRNAAPAARFAALAAGILLSVPLALTYDMLLLTVAIGWLVRAGRESGFRKWEKLAFFFCYVIPLTGRDLGHHFQIPLFPLAPAALLALALGRAQTPNTGGPVQRASHTVSPLARATGGQYSYRVLRKLFLGPADQLRRISFLRQND
jgi:alpha-1,2-mannosyltransferase